MSQSTKPSAAAVEALVRSIEAKEAAATGAAARAAPPPAIEPPRPVDAASETAPTSAPRPDRAAWSLPPLPVALTPVSTATGRGPIPGLIDRQHWEGLIAHEAQRQQRYGQPTAIVLAELEGLDELVARMGPAAVNRLIPPCAGILLSVARASDRVARLATGRFGVLLLETDEAGATRYAARATAATDAWLGSSHWDVRLSVGWTATTDPDDLRRGLRAAEEHLRARRG